MSTTTTQPLPSFSVTEATSVMEMTTSSTLPSVSGLEIMLFLKGSTVSSPTASLSQSPLDTAKTWQELRAPRIKALRGKYRYSLTPSDEFASQKQEDIAREREVT